MEILRSKPINSERLKRDLVKSSSVLSAAEFSRGIKKGDMLACCPICSGSESKNIVDVYGFLYRECISCGSAFVSNPPNENDLMSAYRSDYYTSANKVLLANDSIIDYRVKQIAEPKVRFVADRLTTTKRTWLDIGCGVGEILSAAKTLGFETLGLEANPMEVEYAKKRFGIEIREEYVSASTLHRYVGRYGVVSLFSVLEHVLSPNTILSDVAKIQEKGDNLVIEVPHYPSLSVLSQITFPEHINRMMHPPLHLFLFPVKALELMLKKQGYEIRAAWFFGQDIYEMFSTLGLFVKDLNGSALHQGLAPLMNDLQGVVDNHDLSDEILLIAEKVV
jgi:2-polyprenyl-3-methyl-5-hydroxy-6-metoxy-1,4-benzoquinol methylase